MVHFQDFSLDHLHHHTIFNIFLLIYLKAIVLEFYHVLGLKQALGL
jgi:hypothetical protein